VRRGAFIEARALVAEIKRRQLDLERITRLVRVSDTLDAMPVAFDRRSPLGSAASRTSSSCSTTRRGRHVRSLGRSRSLSSKRQAGVRRQRADEPARHDTTGVRRLRTRRGTRDRGVRCHRTSEGVARRSDASGVTPEAYARVLLADGKKKGWQTAT
jgi:hypothetical protein